MSIYVNPEKIYEVYVDGNWYSVEGGLRIGRPLFIGGGSDLPEATEPWWCFKDASTGDWIEGPLSSLMVIKEKGD